MLNSPRKEPRRWCAQVATRRRAYCIAWAGAGIAGALAVLALLAHLIRPTTGAAESEIRLAALAATLDAHAFRVALVEQRISSLPRPALTEQQPQSAVLVLLATLEIQRALEVGGPLEHPVAVLRSTLPEAGHEELHLASLAAHAHRGVVPLRRLERDYLGLIPLLETQAQPARASSFGRVRIALKEIAWNLHLTERPPPSPLGVAIRNAAEALQSGNLRLALQAAGPLEVDAATGPVLASWLSAARNRVIVEEALIRVRAHAWQTLETTR